MMVIWFVSQCCFYFLKKKLGDEKKLLFLDEWILCVFLSILIFLTFFFTHTHTDKKLSSKFARIIFQQQQHYVLVKLVSNNNNKLDSVIHLQTFFQSVINIIDFFLKWCFLFSHTKKTQWFDWFMMKNFKKVSVFSLTLPFSLIIISLFTLIH